MTPTNTSRDPELPEGWRWLEVGERVLAGDVIARSGWVFLTHARYDARAIRRQITPDPAPKEQPKMPAEPLVTISLAEYEALKVRLAQAEAVNRIISGGSATLNTQTPDDAAVQHIPYNVLTKGSVAPWLTDPAPMPKQKDDAGWVIELPLYYCGSQWSDQRHDAIRFLRKEDAEAEMRNHKTYRPATRVITYAAALNAAHGESAG